MDHRSLAGLVSGCIAVALGALALQSGVAAIWALAGALAGVALVSLGLVGRQLGKAQGRLDGLAQRVSVLEDELSGESEARRDAERRLASRIQLTATRSATQADELTDDASGLYSEGYFTVALQARVATARRQLRPLAVVLIEAIQNLNSPDVQPADPAHVAAAIRATAREADTICRLQDGAFALMLEDTDENGAIWTVERVRRRLAAAAPQLTIWVGVACYPAHGLDVEEILDRADLALDAAREWRQDRIEVARAAPDR